MPDSIDTDTLEAVQSVWAAAPNLPEFVPGRPQAGTLKGGQQAVYTQLISSLESRVKISTKGAWFDYRRLSIIVRGTKEKVVDALAHLRTVFTQYLTLIYPSGAQFIQYWPDQSDQLVQESSREGRDVWAGTVSGRVWSIREV